jgi:hypothetical protein
VLKPYAN